MKEPPKPNPSIEYADAKAGAIANDELAEQVRRMRRLGKIGDRLRSPAAVKGEADYAPTPQDDDDRSFGKRGRVVTGGADPTDPPCGGVD